MAEGVIGVISVLAGFLQEPSESSTRLCIQNETDCRLQFDGQEMDRTMMKEGGQFVISPMGQVSRPDKDVAPHSELAFEFHKFARLSGRGEKNQGIVAFRVRSPAGGNDEFIYMHFVNGASEKRIDLGVEREQHDLKGLVEFKPAFCSVGRAIRWENVAKVGATINSPLREKEMGFNGLHWSTTISEFPKTAMTEFWVRITGGCKCPDLLEVSPWAPPASAALLEAPDQSLALRAGEAAKVPAKEHGAAKVPAKEHGSPEQEPDQGIQSLETLMTDIETLMTDKDFVRGVGLAMHRLIGGEAQANGGQKRCTADGLTPGTRVTALFNFVSPRQAGRSIALGDEGEIISLVGSNSVKCKFPFNPIMQCQRSEVLAGFLPGGFMPGDTVASTISFSWPGLGRSISKGDRGFVYGPSQEQGNVRCWFPNNNDVSVSPDQIRSIADALPGGFALGDEVFLTVDRSWQSGGEGSIGDRGEVVGPAAAGNEPGQGRRVRCRFARDIEEDVPVSQICCLLPGGFKPGDKVVTTKRCGPLAPGEVGIVAGAFGPGFLKGVHTHVEFPSGWFNLVAAEMKHHVQEAG